MRNGFLFSRFSRSRILFFPEFFEKKYNLNLQNGKTLPYYGTHSGGRSSVVEHHVANVMVEGSNPFTRSIFLFSSGLYPSFRIPVWCAGRGVLHDPFLINAGKAGFPYGVRGGDQERVSSAQREE